MTARSLLFGTDTPSRAPDLGLLALRLGVGVTMAFGHGLGKLPPSDGFIDGTAEMGFPLPVLFAWAAALSEFAGGLLIAVGLATRPAALFLAVTMAVATFVRHDGLLFGEAEKAWLFLIATVAILIAGPGRYALDARLRERTGAGA